MSIPPEELPPLEFEGEENAPGPGPGDEKNEKKKHARDEKKSVEEKANPLNEVAQLVLGHIISAPDRGSHYAEAAEEAKINIIRFMPEIQEERPEEGKSEVRKWTGMNSPFLPLPPEQARFIQSLRSQLESEEAKNTEAKNAISKMISFLDLHWPPDYKPNQECPLTLQELAEPPSPLRISIRMMDKGFQDFSTIGLLRAQEGKGPEGYNPINRQPLLPRERELLTELTHHPEVQKAYETEFKTPLVQPGQGDVAPPRRVSGWAVLGTGLACLLIGGAPGIIGGALIGVYGGYNLTAIAVIVGGLVGGGGAMGASCIPLRMFNFWDTLNHYNEWNTYQQQQLQQELATIRVEGEHKEVKHGDHKNINNPIESLFQAMLNQYPPTQHIASTLSISVGLMLPDNALAPSPTQSLRSSLLTPDSDLSSGSPSPASLASASSIEASADDKKVETWRTEFGTKLDIESKQIPENDENLRKHLDAIRTVVTSLSSSRVFEEKFQTLNAMIKRAENVISLRADPAAYSRCQGLLDELKASVASLKTSLPTTLPSASRDHPEKKLSGPGMG